MDVVKLTITLFIVNMPNCTVRFRDISYEVCQESNEIGAIFFFI